MKNNDIQIKCWGNNRPKRGSEDAAGIDLYNNGDSHLLFVGDKAVIETKTAMAIPKGYVGLVIIRSGLGFKGLDVTNSVGVIDADYRGEIKVKVVYTGNNGADISNEENQTFFIDSGERIAQIVIVPYHNGGLSFVNELDDTTRGEKGFGSTGLK